MTSQLSRWRGRKLLCVAALTAGGIFVSPAHALDRSVVGKNGMVVAGHPLAVQAGLKVLQAGGTRVMPRSRPRRSSASR